MEKDQGLCTGLLDRWACTPVGGVIANLSFKMIHFICYNYLLYSVLYVIILLGTLYNNRSALFRDKAIHLIIKFFN